MRPYKLKRFRSKLFGIAVVATILSACGTTSVVSSHHSSSTTQTSSSNRTSSTTQTTATPATLAPPALIKWAPCGNGSKLDCGTVPVPVDYAHPQLGTIEIAVTESPALDQPAADGDLLFNPGGPGESGNQILPIALLSLPLQVRQHFNVVSFDPRGTGASGALNCGTSPSAVISALPIPDSSGEPLPGAAVFTQMAEACEKQTAEPFLNTTDTARDMDRIRQALDVSAISFYGESYGTELGAVYADLFPQRVRSLVLDGAVDVNASLTQQAEQAAPAEEKSLLHLFASCAAEAPCPLGSEPEQYYMNLKAALANHPLPAPGGGDTSPVTVGDLETAALFAISVPDFTSGFYTALKDATAGNGAPLRSLALAFVRDINGDPLVDPLWAITCNDALGHPSSLAAGNLARKLDSEYPLLGGYAVSYTMGGCISWPPARQPVANLHPIGVPPVLVIGNSGDPNTPLIGAVHLAAIFPSAKLIVWNGWGHTWLLSGPTDTCVQGVLDNYLLNKQLPTRSVCN
jgi:pimeloyl-ACP methyl ester carboxylesterase